MKLLQAFPAKEYRAFRAFCQTTLKAMFLLLCGKILYTKMMTISEVLKILPIEFLGLLKWRITRINALIAFVRLEL
jgi:hypothetical protein